MKDLGILPGNVIICAVNVVGLHLNIPHEGLSFLRKHLALRVEKVTLTDAMVALAEIVLESTFNSNKETNRQKWGTAIGRKFGLPYFILFGSDLEERILQNFDLKPYVWWQYIDDIFSNGRMGKKRTSKWIYWKSQWIPSYH